MNFCFKKLIYSAASIMALLLFSGCSSFENHKGEKFPFSIQLFKAETPSPTIIVSHGGSCRLPQEEMWANRFKQWGYNSVVIDHCSVRNIRPHTGQAVIPLAPHERVDDFIATAEWIKTQAWHRGKIAVFGISRGGEAVARAADTRFNRGRRGNEGLAELDVYIALYPAPGSFPKKPRGPFLIMHGEADNLSPIGAIGYEDFVDGNYTIKIYPNAHHGFDIMGADIISSTRDIASFVSRRYEPTAAKNSIEDTRNFLQLHMR